MMTGVSGVYDPFGQTISQVNLGTGDGRMAMGGAHHKIRAFTSKVISSH
jgi:hypothetical protein